MKYFVTVLTDTCRVDQVTYVINTSINAFNYRIEVYENTVLIDAIESEDIDKNEKDFRKKYQLNHQQIRDKYCVEVDKKIISIKSKKNHKKEIDKISLLWYIGKNKLIFLSILVSLVFLAIAYKKLFVYTDIYIDTFYTHKKDKIIYLETIESDTQFLKKNCLALAKRDILEDEIFTISNCRMWCKKHIIDNDECKISFAYFTSNHVNIPNEIMQKEIDIKKIAIEYIVLPTENILELNVTKEFELRVRNRSNHAITVALKNLILDNSNYEEIVQFKHAKTSFLLETNKEKKFHIFLEPSYYKQFKAGSYTGRLEFDVSYKDHNSFFMKQFSFKVK